MPHCRYDHVYAFGVVLKQLSKGQLYLLYLQQINDLTQTNSGHITERIHSVLRVHTRPQGTEVPQPTLIQCPNRNYGPVWLTDPISQQSIPEKNNNSQKCHASISCGYSYSGPLVIAALWPWGRLSLQQKKVPGIFLAVESSRCVRLTSPPSVGPLSGKCGSLNVSPPHGPPLSVTGIALSFFLQALNKIVTTSSREFPHFDGPHSFRHHGKKASTSVQKTVIFFIRRETINFPWKTLS
jgi:hypothetical protein